MKGLSERCKASFWLLWSCSGFVYSVYRLSDVDSVGFSVVWGILTTIWLHCLIENTIKLAKVELR